MPRRSKFTPERTERILTALRTSGCTIRAAAAVAGISESLVHLWLSRGRAAQSGPFRQFYEDVQLAIAESEQVLAERVMAAATKDWRAGAWLLERRFPEYAPTLHLQRHVQKLSDAELQALIHEQLLQLAPALPQLAAPDPADAPLGPGGAGAEAEPIDADFRLDP